MIKQDNHVKIFKAMMKELDDHTTCKHGEIIPCSQMPSNMKQLWQSGLSNANNGQMEL